MGMSTSPAGDFSWLRTLGDAPRHQARLRPEDHDPAGNPRMRGAGRPMPGVELKIIDATGRTLGPGEVGEVATRSHSNMLGYWKLDEATAATIDADGWLRTGDAGYLDADGYLYIQDRVKDMIISGGENIYPAEVESAVYGHPDVAEALPRNASGKILRRELREPFWAGKTRRVN